MKDNNITASHQKMQQRLRTSKLVLDIFDVVSSLLLIVWFLVIAVRFLNDDVMFCEETAKIYFWISSIFIVVSAVFHTILTKLIDGCLEYHYICKNCGHVHEMTAGENGHKNSGYAYCPECQKLTKHKKLSRKEVIAHRAKEDAV